MPIITKEGQIKETIGNIVVLTNIENAENAFALYHNAETLGIEFPTYADGRGFTLAKRLRLLGFAGRLRAIGPLIPDQFAESLDVGFDEIEISDAQLKRQPAEQWFAALTVFSKTYQSDGQKQSIIAARWAKK
jgi:uncharacterized protein (DUF934 family)